MAADFLLRRGRRMFLCNGFELSTAVQFLIHGEQTLETLFEPRPKIAG
ncbi:MAG: hypothetical protein IE886_03225 [Campylobacterales bacterium]|nr:hypothetical protein [Campylobacterales bacterium]